jgi:hypothetical protein
LALGTQHRALLGAQRAAPCTCARALVLITAIRRPCCVGLCAQGCPRFGWVQAGTTTHSTANRQQTSPPLTHGEEAAGTGSSIAAASGDTADFSPQLGRALHCDPGTVLAVGGHTSERDRLADRLTFCCNCLLCCLCEPQGCGCQRASSRQD